MDEKHKKFLDMVANIKIDHGIICGMLDDIAKATHKDALKQLAILRQLLINHFFVEDFIIHPYIRDVTVQSPYVVVIPAKAGIQ